MTDHFVHDVPASRVVLGAGRLATLPDEADRLGLRRLLILTTPEQAALGARVSELLGPRAAGTFAEARMHVPVETVTAAEAVAAEVAADGYVAVGGGSTIGLAKALALTSDSPTIALPTTYAGSEMTPIWGLTEAGVKRTGRDRRVLPRVVIYDPELTLSLPVGISGTSGLNALAHAVEALYAPDTNPVVMAMAEQGVRDLAAALPRIVVFAEDLEARSRALQGAWLCGTCLGATTMGLHHKLCHVLGGMLDLPHAETHAVLLPHIARFNLPAAPVAADSLARALGSQDPADGLSRLVVSLGAPDSLAQLGVAESDLARVAEAVLAAPYSNPREVNAANLAPLLRAAWGSEEPGPEGDRGL